MFKSGTCLRKAYFPGYHFTEDLDFTSRSPWRCEELLGILVQPNLQSPALPVRATAS